MTRSFLSWILTLTLVLASGCDRWGGSSHARKIVTHSGGASSGGRVAVVGPNSLIRGSGEDPAIVWVETKGPDRVTRVAWALVLRHGPWESGGWGDSHAGSSDHSVWVKGQLALGERALAMDYSMREDQETKELLEELELAGNARDLGAGRVFIVDLRAPETTIEQIALPVPAPPVDTVGEPAAEWLLDMLGRDARVAEFLRREVGS